MSIFTKILPFIAIVGLYLLFVKIVLPAWYKIKIARLSSKKTIEITDKLSFKIHTPWNGMQVFYWNDISKVELVHQGSFKVYFHDDSKLLLKNSAFSELSSFVRAIPDSKPINESLKAYKTNYFSDLSCCTICGKIAVKNDQCLSCFSDTYELFLEKTKDHTVRKSAYIRENQLNWFTSYISLANVDFQYDDVLYRNCEEWTPVVTAQEVIDYDKQEFEE